ncbi:CopG family ribbon-helix-helix protein [Methanobacterium alkalithermotolerans]|uniref:CopG family ribbon-helix-helix protein n=1 Tax=Methanobacterium alkalithermotolerans TaxID=2731220 RepID=A0A8T8K865_9EURY|nr:CopG family ribbon-helix-helix protein [Methanobacterium alkalithermotolerans]QUH24012.1 CopG family ribbon-helix-helix protein [Methanobacterium alkalithermotolerans]RJS48432.1 MAG: nickel-responsive regulator 1 [Methanobacterium sp.]
MAIISISLNDKLLAEIDALKDEMGFSGRSDVIRAAARVLIDENKTEDNIKGKVNALLFLIHSQKVEGAVTTIKHDFEDIINTQIHSHLKEENCLEIFILEGETSRIKGLTRKFRNCGKMEHLKLIVF